MFTDVLSCTDTKTGSWTTAFNLETTLSSASGNKQTAVSGLLAAVQLHVLVSEHEDTIKHSVIESSFKQSFFHGLLKQLISSKPPSFLAIFS